MVLVMGFEMGSILDVCLYLIAIMVIMVVREIYKNYSTIIRKRKIDVKKNQYFECLINGS
jgi:hypothetical protein